MTVVKKHLQNLKRLKLKNPILVGFGIKDKQSFDAACEDANGAIIATAFIKALEGADDIGKTTKNFLNAIKG